MTRLLSGAGARSRLWDGTGQQSLHVTKHSYVTNAHGNTRVRTREGGAMRVYRNLLFAKFHSLCNPWHVSICNVNVPVHTLFLPGRDDASAHMHNT